MKNQIIIRKAKISDALAIQKLIEKYAKEGLVLKRSLMEIYENIRDFFVAENGRIVAGCCALHVCWKDLAEIKSLAVKPTYRKSGIGRMLVSAALDEACTIKIKKVFCLTYVPKFFKKFDFKKINKKLLPHKIWNECIQCHKFPNCDEIPMLRKL